MKVAALFVETGGTYFGLRHVDPWDKPRDARLYAGPHRVVAHPPCERWGRYWGGGPSARLKRQLGDDDGCFAAALAAVNRYGGVLEHPEATHAWRVHGIPKPPADRWARIGPRQWTTQVEQGHYGHPARKKTWLYVVAAAEPMALIWGPSEGRRLDEGFHSAAERRAARARGQGPVERLSKRQCCATPTAFRDVLLAIALGGRGGKSMK